MNGHRGCKNIGVVVDRRFSDFDLAELYDTFHPWKQRDDFNFYLPMVMAAESVLDVGCGTGALLHRARQSGHRGRLRGLDPGVGMLTQARRRTDIEWVLGDAASISADPGFDLVIMTGHAFQVLVEDDQVRTSLSALRSNLTDAGRLVFETRNPSARAWENWTPDKVVEITDTDGAVIRMRHEVELPPNGDVVRFTTTFECSRWNRPQTSTSTLRFLGAEPLSSFLSDAGLVIEEQFGDWDRQPLTDASPEIITVARRV